jgi:hypothetical protein
MLRVLILSCVILCFITLSGCLGLIVAEPKECTKEALSAGVIGASPTSSTKEKIVEVWGKPDEVITVSANEETWVYHRKLWCGVMPLILVPLPFMLPVCDGFDRVEFRGNKPVRLHSRQFDTYGYIVISLEPIKETKQCNGPVL